MDDVYEAEAMQSGGDETSVPSVQKVGHAVSQGRPMCASCCLLRFAFRKRMPWPWLW